jgi:hypothetical protein
MSIGSVTNNNTNHAISILDLVPQFQHQVIQIVQVQKWLLPLIQMISQLKGQIVQQNQIQEVQCRISQVQNQLSRIQNQNLQLQGQINELVLSQNQTSEVLNQISQLHDQFDQFVGKNSQFVESAFFSFKQTFHVQFPRKYRIIQLQDHYWNLITQNNLILIQIGNQLYQISSKAIWNSKMDWSILDRDKV